MKEIYSADGEPIICNIFDLCYNIFTFDRPKSEGNRYLFYMCSPFTVWAERVENMPFPEKAQFFPSKH